MKKNFNPGIIVQARMESKRLPGKMIKKLSKKTLLGHILERLKRCKKVKKIILSVPDNKKNLCLIKIAKKEKINFFAGSHSNLVKRYYDTAKKFNIDPIIRIPGDNIIPEPDEIDKILMHHVKQKKKVFSSNLTPFLGSGYPDGIGAEVFNFSLLEEISNIKLTKRQKEHVHINFINYKKGIPFNSKRNKISTIKCPKKYSRPEYSFDINYRYQYLLFKKMYEDLYTKKKYFNITESIKWMDQNRKLIQKLKLKYKN